MKKIIIGFVSVALVVTVCAVLSSVYKYELYELAMEAEASRAGLAEHSVSVEDLKVSYLEEVSDQQQPVMLLIHGFAANKENWLRFAGNLTDQYHIIAVDLLGHGKSTKNPELSHDIDDQVAYLLKFLDKKGIEKVHLVGNSMGGAISSLFAALSPERTLSVSLVNPAGVHDHRSVLQDYLDRGENPLVVKKPEDINVLFDFAMEVQPFVPWPITEVLAERSMANQVLNEIIFGYITSEHHSYDFKAELEIIKAPTLIMWGEKDRVINYKNADVFDQLIPNSTKLIYSDIGHAPMIEIPEKSANDIDAFIKKNA